MSKKTPIPESEYHNEIIQWGIFDFESSWQPNHGLGPTDGIFDFQSQFPIYNTDYLNPLSIYWRFNEHLQRLQGKQKPLEVDRLPKFIDENPHLYLELLMFGDILQESFYFQYRKKIYCYATNTMTPELVHDKQRMKIRFLFDPFKVLGLPKEIEV